MNRPRLGIILVECFSVSMLAEFVERLGCCPDGAGGPQLSADAQYIIMSADGRRIASSCGVFVHPDTGLMDPRFLDYVVVVGDVLHPGREGSASVLRYLREAAAEGTGLVGIGSGTFLLCAAGVMAGHRVCVSWHNYQQLAHRYPTQPAASEPLFVIDRDRLTCSSGPGAAALADFVVGHTREQPDERAGPAARAADLGWMRSGSTDPRIGRSISLMEQSLHRPVKLGALAAQLRLSSRQLERLFRRHLRLTPAAVYERLRMQYARWLLENTSRPVVQIAMDSGFKSGAHFSRRFRELHGQSPTERRVQGLSTRPVARTSGD